MAHVHVLSSDVIARIAAGEVVERPASVVKELMENALDAGATRVEVHLREGGRTLIHVKDNGCGIAREDLGVLFNRHATSKITSADDLEKVLSLGFRGEALYSIGSVAEVNIKSRLAGSDDAWEMDVKGGVKDAARPVAMAGQGTEIRVQEIFFNTPARRKFLKSDASETEQVMNVFLPYALLYPQCHFVFTHNGRTLLDLASAAHAACRMAKALNLDERHLIAGDKVTVDGVTVRLLLGDINIQRPRRDLQYLFVNGRPVQSRNILFHVNDVYRLLMADGVHPAFAVFLDVAPEDVDVNIHPAKREVRIRHETRLGGILRVQAEMLLMTRGGAKEIAAPAPIFPFPSEGPVAGGMVSEGIVSDKIIFAPVQRSGAPAHIPVTEAQPVFAGFAAAAVEQRQDGLKDRLLRARFIGTYQRKYHLFEEGDSLFLVDQHAAQERVLFEKFRRQVLSGAVEVQRLLTPVILKLTPQERLAFDVLGEKLRVFGFDATLLDEGALALQTCPALLGAAEAAARAILAEQDVARVDTDTLARRACRASVMTGDRMHQGEAMHQLARLMACADPFTCPHGRPVFIELKTSFLDRHFQRV